MRPSQVLSRIYEIFTDVSRAIDRSLSVFTRRTRSNMRAPTYSWGRPDYAFWDRAYFGKVQGLELSGLFIRPIVNKIVAWTIGRQPNFMCKNKTTQIELEKWWDIHHFEIMRVLAAALKKGDSFFVVNSDLSISIISPQCVDPIVDPTDYGRRIGWRIRQVFPHPDNSAQKMTITDEYYDTHRIHRVEFTDGRNSSERFENLIGINPVIHIANLPSDGEEFGHPEAEALVEVFHRYGQVLEAAIEGNILQGRPTPVLSFKSLADLNSFWRRYGKRQTVQRSDGTTQETETLSLDLSDLLTISAADFDYKSPAPFTEDTERLLGLCFYLILQHVELPEFSFGNAIEGSKASAETQMPVLEIFIRMRQRGYLGWIRRTAEVVVALLSIIKPGVSREEFTTQFAKISQNGRLTLDAIAWAYGEGLLDERTALLLLPADIENPDEILKQAKRDAKKRQKEQLLLEDQRMKMVAENTPNPEGKIPEASASRNNAKPVKELEDMDPALVEELESLDIQGD